MAVIKILYTENGEDFDETMNALANICGNPEDHLYDQNDEE